MQCKEKQLFRTR